MKSFFSLTNLLMVTIVVGCISLLLFSDRGLINLWSLKKEKLEIQNEINDLRNQIESNWNCFRDNQGHREG